jgi:hypothetical protein
VSNESHLDAEEQATVPMAMAVACLRMAGVLTQARLHHLEEADLAGQPGVDAKSENRQPAGWQVVVEVKQRMLRRIKAAKATVRQAVRLVESPRGLTMLVIVNVFDGVQHRVVLPLVGPQAGAFLESLAGGMPLYIATLCADIGEGGEAVVTGARHSAHIIDDLRQHIRDMPTSAAPVLADAVAMAVRMTEPAALGACAGLSMHDLLVSICLPDEVADLVAAELERLQFEGHLN